MASDMQAGIDDGDGGGDKTRPPLSVLRYELPGELYAAVPQVGNLTQHRPREGEETLNYILRLRGSTTPEEAVTFMAFALVPEQAVWWAYECLRLLGNDLSAADRDLMSLVATWTTHPDAENRYRAMRAALYAPVLTPQVFLALAVGWSGGPIAPNDPAPVPLHRAPRAINSAILSCLAKVDLSHRSIWLARFIDQSPAVFRY